MAKQSVNIGVEGNDGTGDSIRESFRKANEKIFSVLGNNDFVLNDNPLYFNEQNGEPIRSNYFFDRK